MKLILAALLLGAQPAVPAEPPVASEQEVSSSSIQRTRKEGSAAITQIRTDYNSGLYDAMFKELSSSHANAAKDDGLKNLAEMRLGPAPAQEEWEELMQTTISERNKELLRTIADDRDSSVSQKVLSITTPLDRSVEEALTTLARIHTLQPGQGTDADENTLIDIDFEYEYKSLHLDMPILSGQPGEELRAKHMALRMAQMDRMLEASRKFQNASLKAAIETLHTHTDALLAQNWDMIDLQSLMRKLDKSPREDKVTSILIEYRSKFSDLSKDFLAKHAPHAQVEK